MTDGAVESTGSFLALSQALKKISAAA